MFFIRAMRSEESTILEQMLYYCLFVPSGQPPFEREILRRPEISRYINTWGRLYDHALVAADQDTLLGAAWIRLFAADAPGYGFVDADTPEISMAVLPGFRGRGIGTALLKHLLGDARQAGHPSLSLSVDARNPACRLYERLGFERVKRYGHSLTMYLRL